MPTLARSLSESNRRNVRAITELLDKIERRGEKVIKTGWGGVVVTRHEHPQVEKWLVIREGGYLALEKHEQKDEHLEVKEGAGTDFVAAPQRRASRSSAAQTRRQFHFEPGKEHCLVGTEDLLVFERGVDPKGMDQDLIFIYEPESAP